MKRLRVLIVDDEPLVRERVGTLVRAGTDLELVGEAGNGIEALDLIAALDPDLVLLDVEMPEMSGMAVVAALQGERVPAIVFITAYERYALEAFDVGAVDYLHKPISPQRFTLAMERARERLRRHAVTESAALVSGAVAAERARGPRTRFVVREAGRHAFVPVDQIDWIDGADNYLRLHAGERIHLWRGTLQHAADELDPARFVRVHRSIIVAADRIVAVRKRPSGGHELELRDGVLLPSSLPYVSRVKAFLR